MYVSCNIHGQFSGCQLFIAKLKALSNFIFVISDGTSSQIFVFGKEILSVPLFGEFINRTVNSGR